MPKAYVMVEGFDRHGDNGAVRLNYHVVIDAARAEDSEKDYSCQIDMDSTQDQKSLNDRLKAKVLAAANANGYKMSLGDILPYGLPQILDAASYTDKTNGVTSDRTAVAVDPAVTPKDIDTQPTLTARAMASIRSMMSA